MILQMRYSIYLISSEISYTTESYINQHTSLE